ncbi:MULTISPECIES: condensation domain-containing protein, partial [unclassified Bradyrhizobium]|uniref:condensation domain-containing protein n=1 Tax=unclassified Bradyrhizobium TaxID=2631580 RepID=UPI0029160F68
KLERVGIHDNFFELGGHSLLAMRLLERMRQEGLYASVRALFAVPTIAALTEEVSSDKRIEVPPNRILPGCEMITPDMLPLVALGQAEIDQIIASIPGGAANVQDIYPLAPLQEGILFHHLMASEGDVYLLQSLVAFDDRANLEDFLTGLQAAIDRHDVLRSGIMWEGLSVPVQVVWRRVELPIEEVQLDGSANVIEQLLERFNLRRCRLDIRKPPMLQGFVAHDVIGERWLLLLLNHQLAGDHTTLDVLIEEIRAHVLGQADRLPPVVPFRNFVTQARLSMSTEEHKAFFRSMLEGVDEPTAPFGLLDVRGDGKRVGEARTALDPELARQLRLRARALGVSPASLFHVAWAQVLARTSGRHDVVFGTMLFGRMQGGENADRALGLFMNMLPVRIRLGNDSVESSIRHTHNLLTELLRHEYASLALVQRCSDVAVGMPLFTALLNYRYGSQLQGQAAPTAWEGVELLGYEERTNYPLTLTVDDLGEGFLLTAQVQEPVAAECICNFMHMALTNLVDVLEHAPARPIQSLDLLPDVERERLVVEWNATRADYPAEKCLHEL